MKCVIGDITINYEEFGSGKPILCLHGFQVDHRIMTGSMEPFFGASKEYRRIYLDLPGMGRSTSSTSIKNADDMLSILNKFVEKVIGKEHFLLAGLSYGGYLSIGMVLQNHFNIDGLLLISPCVVSNHNKRKIAVKDQLIIEPGLESKNKNNPDFADFLAMAVIASSETWLRYQKEILVGIKSADEVFTAQYQENGYSFSFESSFAELNFNKAITIITGRQDNSVGFEDSWDLFKHLPQLKFVTLENAGHNLTIEHPEAFNHALEDWLNNVRMI